MTRMTRSSCCLLCALVAFWAAVPVQRSHAAGITPRYGITDLGVMPGTTKSIATGINSSGQVVGVSYNTNDPLHQTYDSGARSFLYGEGTTTEIQPIGGPARAINDSGLVVGGGYVAVNSQGQYVGTADPQNGPFVLVDGTKETTLNWFVPDAISNTGVISGHIYSPTLGGDVGHAAFYQNGQITDIHKTLNRQNTIDNSYAIGINSSNDMLVLAGDTKSGYKDFVLYSHGMPVYLGKLPGSPQALDARDLNDLGQIVGAGFLYEGGSFASTPDGLKYQPGQFLPLKDLIPEGMGWSDLVATAINDEGLIVGQGTINGQQRAFLMAPAVVPEPATIVVFGAMAFWFGARYHRRLRELRCR